MIAMAITQIHTHRRNGHRSWRVCGADVYLLDATRPRTLEWMEAPTQRRQRGAANATTSRLGAIPIAGSRTVTLEDGNSPIQRSNASRDQNGQKANRGRRSHETRFNQITFDQITFDQITFDQITFDHITFDSREREGGLPEHAMVASHGLTK